MAAVRSPHAVRHFGRDTVSFFGTCFILFDDVASSIINTHLDPNPNLVSPVLAQRSAEERCPGHRCVVSKQPAKEPALIPPKRWLITVWSLVKRSTCSSLFQKWVTPKSNHVKHDPKLVSSNDSKGAMVLVRYWNVPTWKNTTVNPLSTSFW